MHLQHGGLGGFCFVTCSLKNPTPAVGLFPSADGRELAWTRHKRSRSLQHCDPNDQQVATVAPKERPRGNGRASGKSGGHYYVLLLNLP